MLNLELIFNKIDELKQLGSVNNELDWKDYNFAKNFYNNVARNNKQTDSETKFIIDKLRLKSDAKILDLGCGGGRNCFDLSDHGYKVTGIDLSEYAIKEANKTKSENNKYKDINFIHKDILDINYNEEFNAAILIFNHFSSFNNIQVKKLLKKIHQALTHQGKILIEISSHNQILSLHGVQEWAILDSWLAGYFKQLVLIDNIVDNKKEIHIRKDYCVRLSDGQIFEYTQTSYIYDLEKIHALLRLSGLKLIQTYGNWQGKIFDDNDDQMILIIQK
ncbi:MAG: class I SAM-dependent methyltransferase [Candidatus Sericytochromatia bacterium]|nr:class I SAM-dependent methyltransferase [Candidatus Sericytochromatia bacterium]